MTNTRIGHGTPSIALSMYETLVLTEVAAMRRAGVYVCFANIMPRLPKCNQEMLWSLLWTMALAGQLT